MDGHWGCPKCGCPRFYTNQDITEYGTQKLLCTFATNCEAKEPQFDVDDYLDTTVHTSESGDFGEDKRCRECRHTYTKPQYFPSVLDVHKQLGLYADTRGLPPETLHEKLGHAASVSVAHERHATVIFAQPRTEKRDTFREGDHITLRCCACNAEADELFPKTEQLYVEATGSVSGRQRVLDVRQLPVILRSSVCSKCR